MKRGDFLVLVSSFVGDNVLQMSINFMLHIGRIVSDNASDSLFREERFRAMDWAGVARGE